MRTLVYLLQVSACTGIFYSFYFLLLRRFTFFTLNRWYLLATLLLSFVIPALQIPVNTSTPSSIMQPVIYVQQMRERPQVEVFVADNTPVVKSFDWLDAVQIAYIAMAVLSVAHLIFTLYTFFSRLKSKQLMQIGNVKVLKGGKKLGNSSFLNVIFINDDELEPHEVKQIITHEMLHVRLMHSTDRLIARVIQIVLWFNPFAYCYIRSIEENHEFEVDRIVAGEDGKGMYAQLLFKLAVSGQSYLFHNFSKVPLKKRISMLFNQPTSNMKKIIYVLILPMLVISCLAFANLKNDQPKKISAVGELKGIGKHPLVIIDGKEYAPEILYTISNSCIASSMIFGGPADKKFGPKAKDGYVEIKTHKKKIVYLTAIEKDNLVKEAALPNRFYSRITLKNNDGTTYDKIIIRMPSGGKMTSDITTGGKAAFVIGQKTYTEAQSAEVETIVKKSGMNSFGTGDVKTSDNETIKKLTGYETYFQIKRDTTNDINKYRQRIRRNGKEIKGGEERDHKAAQVWFNTDEFKAKKALSDKASGKTLTYKVVAVADTNYKGFLGHVNGYKVCRGTDEYLLTPGYGNKFSISGLLQPGEEVKIEAGTVLYGREQPVVINPKSIEKNGKVVYNVGNEQSYPKYAFLYEANAVRFTDGKLTSLQKYADGKWKSAIVEVDGGFKIKLNLKPSAPSFANIKPGDQVRFRFVHEIKTGEKEYTVNDWVAMSNDIKQYGVKNPEYFGRFYSKI